MTNAEYLSIKHNLKAEQLENKDDAMINQTKKQNIVKVYNYIDLQGTTRQYNGAAHICYSDTDIFSTLNDRTPESNSIDAKRIFLLAFRRNV